MNAKIPTDHILERRRRWPRTTCHSACDTAH